MKECIMANDPHHSFYFFALTTHSRHRRSHEEKKEAQTFECKPTVNRGFTADCLVDDGHVTSGRVAYDAVACANHA